MLFFKNTAPLLISVVSFAILFRHGELGLNVFLFDAILLIMALWYRPNLGKYRAFVWAVAGLLFSAVSIIVVHGPVSILAHGISTLLILGFAQARELRFIWFGALLGLTSIFQSPLRWGQLRSAIDIPVAQTNCRRVFPWLRQAIIPLLVALPFFALYGLASERFGAVFAYLGQFDLGADVWWDCLIFLIRLGLGALLVTPRFCWPNPPPNP